MQSTPASELHPAAVADLVVRLEDAAILLTQAKAAAPSVEHRMALHLGCMWAREAALVIFSFARASRLRAPVSSWWGRGAAAEITAAGFLRP
jgi:hypothetical protein